MRIRGTKKKPKKIISPLSFLPYLPLTTHEKKTWFHHIVLLFFLCRSFFVYCSLGSFQTRNMPPPPSTLASFVMGFRTWDRPIHPGWTVPLPFFVFRCFVLSTHNFRLKVVRMFAASCCCWMGFCSVLLPT